MKYLTLAKVLLAGLTGLSLTLPALAEDALVTDVGTLRQGDGGEGLSRQARLFALGRPQFPDPAALRRHPSPHGVFV